MSVNGPHIDAQRFKVAEPTFTLSGLTQADIDMLDHALFTLYDVTRDDYERIMSLKYRVAEAAELQTHDEYLCMHYDDGCRCQCSNCKR